MIESLTKFDWVRFFELGSPFLALLLCSMLLFAYSIYSREDEHDYSAYIAVAGLMLAFSMSWRLWLDAKDIAIAMFMFSRTTMIGMMLCVLTALFVAVASIPYIEKLKKGAADYYGLILMSTLGMCVLVAAYDLVTILLGMVLMFVPVFAIVQKFASREGAIENALKLFFISLFAISVYVFGMAFLFGSVGATNLALILERAPDVALGGGRAFLLFGVSLTFIGLAFVIAMVPFHVMGFDLAGRVWMPVTVLITVGFRVAGFIACMRLAIALGASAGDVWHNVVWVLCVVTMAFGAFAAIREEDIGRLIIYTSIAQAGFMLMLFPSVSADGGGAMRALILYLVAYVAMSLGANVICSTLEFYNNGPVEIAALAGLARKRPLIAFVFAIFLLSLAGLPPWLGFFGRSYLFLAAIRNGDFVLVLVAALVSVILVYSYLRPAMIMYCREERNERSSIDISPMVVAMLAIAAAVVVVFGFLPENLVAMARSSVGTLLP